MADQLLQTEIKIDSSKLPTPELEYVAERAFAIKRGDNIYLGFADTDFEGNNTSMVVVRYSRTDFAQLKDRVFSKSFNDTVQTWCQENSETKFDESWMTRPSEDSRYMKYAAAFDRMAMANGRANIDFFTIPSDVRGLTVKSIKPQISVAIPTGALGVLLRQIEGL